MREKISVLVLRITTVLCAVAGVLLCVFALPSFGTEIARNLPEHAFWQYPILLGLYAAAACFFHALFRFWLLLNGLGAHQMLSTKELKAIRFSAIAFGALYYLSAMPIIFLAAEADDAPGVILIGAFLGTFPLCVAAIAAILERILGDTPKERQA